jgi:hypothetical protein
MRLSLFLEPGTIRIISGFLRVLELSAVCAVARLFREPLASLLAEIKKSRVLQGGFTDSEPGSPVPNVWADGRRG